MILVQAHFRPVPNSPPFTSSFSFLPFPAAPLPSASAPLSSSYPPLQLTSPPLPSRSPPLQLPSNSFPASLYSLPLPLPSPYPPAPIPFSSHPQHSNTCLPFQLPSPPIHPNFHSMSLLYLSYYLESLKKIV